MKQGRQFPKLDLTLIALLLIAMGYLGLSLLFGSFSPFLVVQGRSMEPGLHAGDLLISSTVTPTHVKVGDIIAFNVPADARERMKLPTTVAHRVLRIEGNEGQLAFVTKGDNSDVDPFKVPHSEVRGVVLKNLGPLGLPFLVLANKTALLVLVLSVGTFILTMMAGLWLIPNETAASQRPPVRIEQALDGLASAVSEYGVHLQSHTAIVRNLGSTSESLDQAVDRHNRILTDLGEVVSDLKRMGIKHSHLSNRGFHRRAMRAKKYSNIANGSQSS